MITLWMIAGAMLLVALVLVLRPLLSVQPLPALDQQDANVAVFRRRLAELDADCEAGLLTEPDAAEARLELERQLLGDLDPLPVAQPRRRPAYGAAAVVGLLLPAASLALYLQLGKPTAAPDDAAVHLPQDEQGQLAFIRERLGELEARVEAAPDDLEALLMLGRAYLALQRYDDAVSLYAAAEPRLGAQPVLLVDFAEALGYVQGGSLAGKPLALLERALAADPALPKALWLAGLAAMQAQRPEQARQYWQRLLAVLPDDGGTADQVRALLAQLGEPQAPATSLQVEVRLSPTLAERVPPGATVFVLARAVDGPRAPLAVIRRPAEQLPFAVRLDESMAMVPGMSLREFPQVILEARISASGDAAGRPGDLAGRSGAVTVGSDRPVELVIDRIVR